MDGVAKLLNLRTVLCRVFCQPISPLWIWSQVTGGLAEENFMGMAIGAGSQMVIILTSQIGPLANQVIMITKIVCFFLMKMVTNGLMKIVKRNTDTFVN